MSTKKIALVTGGSRGLGKNMALALAQKGIGVVLTYNSKKDEAQEVVTQIEQAGGKAAALQLNTGDVKSFDAFYTRLREVLANHFQASRFDFLINNAGIGLYGAFAEMSEEHFDLLVNIHFKGVYFLTQKALPVLNDGGRIINLSTGLARFSLPGYSAYGAAKGAVETLTRYMARELGARGIAVNAVAPGAIMTDFGGGHLRDSAQLREQVSNMTALGRPGEADDIGGVVAFLCSEDGRWINGQRIEVSGGMNL